HMSVLLSSTDPHPTTSSTLSLHDALPISIRRRVPQAAGSFRPAAPTPCGRQAVALRRRTGEGAGRRGNVPGGCKAESRLAPRQRSEEHTSELQSRFDIVCRLPLEKKKRRG